MSFHRLAIKITLALSLSYLLVGCSGSSSGGPPVGVRPQLRQAVQDRNLDTFGRTVVFRFDNPLQLSSVSKVDNYEADEGQKAVLALLEAPRRVRVFFDKLVVPRQTKFAVRNLRNQTGGHIAEQLGVRLDSTDNEAPRITSAKATAVENSFNDVITVQFNDLMIPDEVLDPSNYTFSTNGTPIDLTQSTFAYDTLGRTLTIRLTNNNPVANLVVGEMWNLTVANARDLGGNRIGGGARSTERVTGDTVAPDVLQATQNTAVDPLGATVDIAFDEVVSDTSVTALSNYSASGGQTARAAKLIWPGDMVQVSFDAPVVPGTHTIDIAGVRDLAGNEMVSLTDETVVSPDLTPPTLDAVAATTISGPYNDIVSVRFDEQILPFGATTATNYELTSPVGNQSFVLDPDTVLTYDHVTRTTTIVLASQSNAINLKTDDQFEVTVNNVRDVAGNTILANTQSTGTIGGDRTSPQIVQATQNTTVDPLGKTIDVTFTEVLDGISASDSANYVHSNGKSAIAASTLGSNDVVRVSFADPVVPLQDTVNIQDVEDLAGNLMTPVTDLEVAKTDTTPPVLSSITVDAVSGQFNDIVVVNYDEPVLPGGATMLANFTLVVGGAPVSMDPTDTLISYDQAARATTIVLSSRTTPENVPFGANYTVTADNISDVAGNVMQNQSMQGIVGGDNIRPRLLGAAVNTVKNTGNDYIVLNFDEEIVEGDALNPANYVLAITTGATGTVDLTGANFGYVFDGPTSQVVALLPLGVNLKTGDNFNLTVQPAIGDHAGNSIDPSANGWTGSVQGDATPPALEQATQRTSVDPSGATVDLAFDEEIDADSLPGIITAKVIPGLTAPPAPTLVSASLIGTTTSVGAMVRLTFDGPLLPTAYGLHIQGLKDLAGNDMAMALDERVTAEDTTPPDLFSAGFEIEKGARNDDIFITFSERMLPTDAIDLNHYSLVGPGGTSIPLAGDNVIYYDNVANRAHIVLISQKTPVNLQYGKFYRVVVDGLRDLAGNFIPFGTTTGDNARGDNRGPIAQQATQKTTINPAGTTVFVTFDETLDLATAQNINNYTGDGATPLSAVVVRSSTGLLTDIVALTFAQPMPDGVRLEVLAAKDLAGNSNNNQSLVVDREDQFDPQVASVTATTIANRQNDIITVVFSERVLAGEATSPSSYRFWSPANATQDSYLADASIFYDENTMTATIQLDSPVNRVDLKNEPLPSHGFKMLVRNIHDVSGRSIAQGPGINDFRGPVRGDSTRPTILSAAAAPGLPFVLHVTFSEELDEDSLASAAWKFTQTLQTVIPVPGATALLADGKTVRLAMLFPIFGGDVELMSGLEDLAGNHAVPGTVPIN